MNLGKMTTIHATIFLGGVQLINNIQVFAYKNDEQHWLSVYKDDKFIDFVTHGPEINGLIASRDGKWFTYFQRNPETNVNEFIVWKYNQINANEHEIVPYTQINLMNDECRTDINVQACFNSAGTHVACLGEWNHIYVIDLRRLDAPTEFYRCGIDGSQIIYDAGDHFVWIGQDECARIIDLTTKHPTMWKFEFINTKYLFVHNQHIIYMSIAGAVGIYKSNLRAKRCDICNDVHYPTGRYEDITIEEYFRIKLHKKDGTHYYIDL